MAPRRYAPPPPLRCTQRSTLEPAKCPTVDTVLKQLKACSRRLQAALSSHRTDLQVLERLYYKGKNQHRSALFWQRVAEIRRLGERVDEMHMDDVVESLRASFWGEQPSLRTAKVMKGPWTHYSDANALLFVLERCSACCMLIDRARERLVRAYESFTLMMQTGAFLQLILVLAAIASRMSILLSEVRAALEVSWSAAYKCLSALFPSEKKSVRVMLVNAYEKDNTPASAVRSKSHSRVMSVVSATVDPHDEDLGSTLARPRPVTDHPMQATSSSSVLDTPPLPDTDVILRAEAFSLSNELSVSHSPETIPSHSIAAQVSVITSAASSTTSASKRKKMDGEGPKQTKKKKKKRDEIDDIFGF